MLRRLAQQMTLSDLEWPFHASRAISAVAELLVVLVCAVALGLLYCTNIISLTSCNHVHLSYSPQCTLICLLTFLPTYL